MSLLDTLRASLAAGPADTTERTGRCIGCNRWVIDHFGPDNKFVSCIELDRREGIHSCVMCDARIQVPIHISGEAVCSETCLTAYFLSLERAK